MTQSRTLPKKRARPARRPLAPMGPPHHPSLGDRNPKSVLLPHAPFFFPAPRGFLLGATRGLVPGDQKAKETRSPPGGLKPSPHLLRQPHTFQERCCLWLGMELPVTLLGTGEGPQARSLPQTPGAWLLWARTRLMEPRQLLASAHGSKDQVLSTRFRVPASEYCFQY